MTFQQYQGTALTAMGTALLLLVTLPAVAQDGVIDGVTAIPGAKQLVTGQMTVVEKSPLSRQIELVYRDAATGEQVRDFDVELTQELHILAVDEQLNELVHEHVREASADGRFVAELQFPHPGTYHIYTDAVPSGYGQQVLRFDVPVGAGEASHMHAATATDVTSGPISSSDGAYTVELDATQVRAGQEGVMSLHVSKDGAPATDLAPYLGVAAHVVLIGAADLGYVHAHALAGDGAAPGGMDHGSHSMGAMEPATDHSAEHGGHDMAAEPMPAMEHADGHSGDQSADAHAGIMGVPGTVPPELTVYVTLPAAGTYGLWIEFVGGDQVITVPFKIDVPAT